jgi:hypothetical protein
MFAGALIDEGFSVWWDGSLHSGETFDEVIEQKLRDSKAVIVLWSPRSVSSRWVRAEATQADRRHKLMPAIIEPCDRPIIFELTHAADLCDWAGDITDTRWRSFMDDLRRLVDAVGDHQAPLAEKPMAKPQPTPAPPSERERSRAQAASRHPLRPGNDEVIFAGTHPAPRTHQAHRGELPMPQSPERDPNSEVHCLELENGELGEELFVVDASGMKIGRTSPADIVLSHKSVSREHCLIGVANDELLVTDLNSTNGTHIDGVRITRATIFPVGSVLRLGQISLRHSIRTRAEAEQRSHVHNANKQGGLQAGRLAATS